MSIEKIKRIQQRLEETTSGLWKVVNHDVVDEHGVVVAHCGPAYCITRDTKKINGEVRKFEISEEEAGRNAQFIQTARSDIRFLLNILKRCRVQTCLYCNGSGFRTTRPGMVANRRIRCKYCAGTGVAQR